MFFLAFKHLTARKKQSLLTLMGVALGTTAFITFSAIMTGFQNFIIDQLVNNDAHVKISAQDAMVTDEALAPILFPEKKHVFWLSSTSGRLTPTRIEYPIGWYTRLAKDPRVYSYAPQLGAMAIFTKGGVTLSGKLQGVDPEQQARVTNIENYMTQGEFNSLKNAGGKAIVGDGLLKKLGARLGDTIMVTVGLMSPAPVKISGVFKIGITTLDDSFIFAHLRDVQSITQRPSEITDIAIRLTDVELAQDFAKDYSLLTQDKVQSWDQNNANILSVFSLQNFIRSFITIAIMVVASFGIYNIISILVNQKRKDIGILKSMGYNRFDIQELFLIQGLVLGLTGGVVGLTLGFFMSLYLSTLKIGGMMDKMVVNFSPKIYLIGFLMATISAIVSSYLPARAAGKLRPIDIVRSGE